MARPWWKRTLALFLGLWFTVVTVGPEDAHACPSHDVAAGVDHSAHHATAPASETTPHDSDEHCMCVGQCGMGASAAVTAHSNQLVDSIAAATRGHGLPDYQYVPVARQHVLPFAHAPPLA